MSITAVPPVKAAQPPQSNTPATDKQSAGIGKGFVSVTNVPIGTRVLAALGNVKAEIRMAACQGNTAKLQAFLDSATLKRNTANAKLGMREDAVGKAAAREKSLGAYDRGKPLSRASQKAHNENVDRHAQAAVDLRIAERKWQSQSDTVARYERRMALAFQSLENLGRREKKTD
jgi:hypothetical protein